MRLLIIGQGGREHAIYTKFTEDRPDNFVKILPGNGGIPKNDRLAGSALDFPQIRRYIREYSIDTVLVGPEQPLVEGIADFFEQKGHQDVFIFGPAKKAAKLEGSKAFAKDFMKKYNIPSAKYAVFDDIKEALDYLKDCDFPLVIKASGLAAGKGVSICNNLNEATGACKDSLSGKAFGDAGKKIIIEEFLRGNEVSVFAVCDGKNYQVLGTAQDYKRAFDEDQGPNTGGMGAFSPATILSKETLIDVKKNIIEPTLKGMQQEGCPYKGILYIGLMIQNNLPYVIEYNCRMGDPESQVVLPLLSTPLEEILEAARLENLDKIRITQRKGFAVTVVLAKQGYPQEYSKGTPIKGLKPANNNCKIYHAGTETDNINGLTSTGGRVLNFTGIGLTLKAARQNAYDSISKIQSSGFFYRKDIAQKYL